MTEKIQGIWPKAKLTNSDTGDLVYQYNVSINPFLNYLADSYNDRDEMDMVNGYFEHENLIRDNVYTLSDGTPVDSIKNFTDIEDFLIIQEKIIRSDHFIDKSVDLISNQNISIGELCKKIKKIYPQFKFIQNRKHQKKTLIPKPTYLKKIFDKYDFKNIDQIIKECLWKINH